MTLDMPRYLEIIKMGAGLIHSAASSSLPESMDLEVPHCPGWDMRELCDHQGYVFYYAAERVRERAGETYRTSGMPAKPDTDEGLLEWFQEATDAVLQALKGIDPKEEIWNWTAAEDKAGFWFRRMTHEVTIHAYDATLAAGSPCTIDSDVGADGVDELLCSILPTRFTSLKDLPQPSGTFHIHRTDAGTEATVNGSGGTVDLAEWFCEVDNGKSHVTHQHKKGDAALRGSGGDLMLALWQRLPLDDSTLDLLGDKQVAEEWLAFSP